MFTIRSLAGVLLGSVIAVAAAAARDLPRADATRIETHIQALSKFGANPEGGVSRVAFSNADIAGREYVATLMHDAGLTVRVDASGNLIGRRAGSNDKLPPIVLGSHTDSVPGGGNYDGNVGVLGAIEAVQVMNEHKLTTQHPIEVVSFADEEGAMVGSRGMVGELTAAALEEPSHSGISVGEGIRRLGGDPERIATAARKRGDIAAYLELHIEQGAVLDESKTDIGVVEGIVGIRWWDVTVAGMANHAGTTPMNRRQDALVAAAELVLAVNRVANDMPGRQVATVGRVQASPGAPNVIPGSVTVSLEIRDLDASKMQQVFERIESEARRIADARSTPISFKELDVAAAPAPTDPRMRDLIADAAKSLGLKTMRLPSGAGHDAQHMAQIAPTGMIFVPSAGGISHAPREYTAPQDMANGVNVLLQATLAVDREFRQAD